MEAYTEARPVPVQCFTIYKHMTFCDHKPTGRPYLFLSPTLDKLARGKALGASLNSIDKLCRPVFLQIPTLANAWQFST